MQLEDTSFLIFCLTDFYLSLHVVMPGGLFSLWAEH